MRSTVPVFVVTLGIALAFAQAKPQFEQAAFDYTTTRRPLIPVISRQEIRDEIGQVALNYVSGDGTVLNQRALLKPSADGKRKVLVQQGSYSYTAPDGTPVHVSYIADETGFHPVGDVILTGDSVPAPAPAPVPASRSSLPINTPKPPVPPTVPTPYVQSSYAFTNPYVVAPVVAASAQQADDLPPGFFRLF